MYAHYPSLVGRTVLITGGATGIGASLVEHFVQQGSKVGFIDIDQRAGGTLVAQLNSACHAPLFVHGDVTDTTALHSAIVEIRSRLGQINVLINNAANDTRHTVEETTPELWDAYIAINLKHTFFAIQAIIEDMRQLGGGSIINFGSPGELLKHTGMPVYTAAKAAVEGLTRSLHETLALITYV